VGASGGDEAKSAAGGRSSKRRSSGESRGEDLSALSKAELLARASDLAIPGRSKMNRDELEAAVASATKSPRRRKAS
jgi:DNA end-binding protein Ku